MSRFFIIAPVSALSRRTRLFKIAKFVKSSTYDNIIHVGWERLPNETEEKNIDFFVEKNIILKGGGYGGGKIKLYYFIWMLKVFIYSFKLKKKDVVWALGFESAFPLLLASKIIGFRLYFDDADRFSMLFNFPKPIKHLLEFLERITSRNAYKHIIPVYERYDFDSSKFTILRNFPSESEITLAKKIYGERNYIQDKIIINVNGWLGSNRGMDIILKLCQCKIDGVSFILAGKLDCSSAHKIIEYSNVQYLGEVTNAEALASYYASDFVFTYYKPNSIINTLAASNKWGDAIKIGVGVIVNDEVRTAQYLRDSNACLSIAYENVELLETEICNLILEKYKLETIKSNVKDLSNKFDYFENQLKNIIL